LHFKGFAAAIAACGEQFERAATVGFGNRACGVLRNVEV
jgi:hypothetical protein